MAGWIASSLHLGFLLLEGPQFSLLSIPKMTPSCGKVFYILSHMRGHGYIGAVQENIPGCINLF